MSICYYSANRILDRNFGSTAYSPPATYYVALSTTTINIDGTGITEPATGSYARVAMPNDKSNWGGASNGSLANSASVTFIESTGSWGTITTVALTDNGSTGGGNIWFFDTLTPSRAVASSTTVLFAVGAITCSMSNS